VTDPGCNTEPFPVRDRLRKFVAGVKSNYAKAKATTKASRDSAAATPNPIVSRFKAAKAKSEAARAST
jgi:hypothetical protein